MNINLDIHVIKNRQCTIPVTINKKNYIYADISNNKKKNIINMNEIHNSIEDLEKVPIKQYKSNVNEKNDQSDKEESLSILDKRLLKDKVLQLSKDECKIVFNMIKKDTNKFTQNNNGIFINLDKLTNKTLLEINNYVNTVTKNKFKTNDIIVNEICNSVNISSSQSKIKLSNYEKSIIKRNNYIEEQKNFKNSNNWFIKKDSMGNDINE